MGGGCDGGGIGWERGGEEGRGEKAMMGVGCCYVIGDKNGRMINDEDGAGR